MSHVGLLAAATLLACARAYEDVSAAEEAGGDVAATLSCSFHGSPPPKISWRFQAEIADGTGRHTLTSDGLLVIDPLHPSDSGIYTCEADNGLEVATQQVHLIVNGVDCELYEECGKLQHCDFGVERRTDVDGCERCECKENPCKTKSCAEGTRCVLQKTIPLINQESLFSAECKTMVKTGACPPDETSPYNDTCPHECADDADCRGVGKCCRRGCSLLCLAPVTQTNINYFFQQIIYPAFVPVFTIKSELPEVRKTTTRSLETNRDSTTSEVTPSDVIGTSEGTSDVSDTSNVTTDVIDTTEVTSDVIGTSTLDACSDSEFGCCADKKTKASGPKVSGPDNVGCPGSCSTTQYGCCQDGKTPAHGPEFEGCCLLAAFGCCPDYRKPAEGPDLEGCGCQYALYGCCPDNVTIAQGPDNLGCGCQYTQYGCCLDRHTAAFGSNNEGCACNTYQFGCCADGVSIAKGPDQQGCHCNDSKFGCCGDGETPATGLDATGCDCSSSQHGCCPDGLTEAAGPKFLGCTDAPENKQAACSLSTDPGPCHNFTAMWYYDVAYGGCSRFWYGGCEGNGNRFSTKADCEDVCVQPSPKDACKLPSVKGACDGDYARWHYNSTREQCIPFRYGGCLGNANNFDTRELCQKQCEPSSITDQCDLLVDQGSCAGNYSRWGFNPEAYHCEQFTWGGCEGNSNRFSSEAACQMRCADKQPHICQLPMVQGPCDDSQMRWFYDSSTDSCSQFTHGGCGGNDNSFESFEACEYRCRTGPAPVGPTTPTTTVAASGPLECRVPESLEECHYGGLVWYFEPNRHECVSHSNQESGVNCRYTGTFFSEEACQRSCGAFRGLDQCDLPVDQGSCAGNYSRWGFNPEAQRCEQFIWGGCEGNSNRFSSEAACQMRCADKQPHMPAAPVALPQREPEVAASEGGIVTLRCLFHGNPPPTITWRVGKLTIGNNAGRYRLMSDGSLQIVSLYRNDAGNYTCEADNGVGVATQDIHLVVNDPVKAPAGIAGDENAVVTGELGQPLYMRCLAYGYPPPAINWYHGGDGTMVPYHDAVYEAGGDVLLIRSLAVETLGKYTCQAYNGEGKAASWVVIVRAYMPEGVFIENEYLVPRNTLPPRLRTQPPTSAETSTSTTTSTTTEAPRLRTQPPTSAETSTTTTTSITTEAPRLRTQPLTSAEASTTTTTTSINIAAPRLFTVPVSAHVSTRAFTKLNIGDELRLTCEIDGFPEPNAYWTKDGVNIQPDGDRISITGSTIVSRLLVARVTVADSGLYACHASNSYSSQSVTAHINVQQLTIPANCTDNPFFANCDLIVRSMFCRHQLYETFCCKSCVEAGQLDPLEAALQADQPLKKK